MAVLSTSKYRLSLVFVLALFFCLQYFFASARFQSFKFADESEHLVPAYEMIFQDKKLYKDLSTNHQPGPIYLAATVLKLLPTSNMYMLVERTRQFMFALSFLGAAVLVLRFGLLGLLAAVLIEIGKFYLFGYHLLAESVAVYPIMLIGGLVAEKVLLIKTLSKKVDILLLGVTVSFVALSLLPTWPFLLLVIFFYRKDIWQYKSWFLVPFLITTTVLFSKSDFLGWISETIVNNYQYFIPYERQGDVNILSLLSFPLRAFGYWHEPVARYYALLLVLAGLSFKFLRMRSVLTLWLMFTLLNLRVANPGVSFYGGFHLLPQMAFLTIVGFFLAEKLKKLVLALGLTALIVSSIGWWLESGLFTKTNEHFISYGESESIAMALAAIKNPGDELLAGPQEGLINLAATIPSATRQTAYLDWAYRVPRLRQEFTDKINLAPPTFIYFPESTNQFFLALKPLLATKYTRINRTFGDKTDLYISTKNLSLISDGQWQMFRSLMYEPSRGQNENRENKK